MTLGLQETRYDRQQLLTWWDQRALSGSRVLVVGAGAIGNELLKNLVLLGVGSITVVDLDVVARSNLARCVLFRAADEGKPKAPVAAAAAAELNTDVTVEGLVADIRDQPLGWLANFDLVLGGLDNREARLWVNASCRKLGMPWVDGAIEGLRAIARVFLADGPCYECTLGEADRAVLAIRQSCALLSNQEMLEGKVPTTATSSSFVAAVQVQEAVKLLTGRHDLLALRGQGFTYVGDTLDAYTINYSEDPYCLAHDTYGPLEPVPVGEASTLFDVLAAVGATDVVAVDLEDDLVLAAVCRTCDTTTDVRRRLAALRPGDGECRTCHQVLQFDSRRSLSPDSNAELLGLPLRDLDLRDLDVVTLRRLDDRRHLVLREASS